MKTLRTVVVVALILVAFGGLSFAGKAESCKWQDKCQAEINDLKTAATTLQASDPELAAGLNTIIADKEQKLQEMATMKTKMEERKTVLRNSAAALQKTNPELANTLWEMSEHHRPMGKMGHGMKGCTMDKKGPVAE
jgi:hypothetical protein